MRRYPYLVRNYIRFCNLRLECLSSKKLDFRNCRWLSPTTLLPLGEFIRENQKDLELILPTNKKSEELFKNIIAGQPFEGDPFHLTTLPRNAIEADRVLNDFYTNMERNRSPNQALRYLVSELSDNIYQHSNFKNALLANQINPLKSMIEIAVFDNGVTIPGNFERHNIRFSDLLCMTKAIEGLSTREPITRGYGLSSSTDILRQGLRGEVLLVSRGAAVFLTSRSYLTLSFGKKFMLNGTLISMRIKYPLRKVDIYDYVSN